jgi:hypothetical protein
MVSRHTSTDRQIAELARFYRWRHHSTSPVLTLDGRSDAFPTHALVKGHRLLFVTCAARGRLLRSQRQWLESLARVTEVQPLVIEAQDLRELTQILRGTAREPATTQDARPRPRSGRRIPKAPTR